MALIDVGPGGTYFDRVSIGPGRYSRTPNTTGAYYTFYAPADCYVSLAVMTPETGDPADVGVAVIVYDVVGGTATEITSPYPTPDFDGRRRTFHFTAGTSAAVLAYGEETGLVSLAISGPLEVEPEVHQDPNTVASFRSHDDADNLNDPDVITLSQAGSGPDVLPEGPDGSSHYGISATVFGGSGDISDGIGPYHDHGDIFDVPPYREDYEIGYGSEALLGFAVSDEHMGVWVGPPGGTPVNVNGTDRYDLGRAASWVQNGMVGIMSSTHWTGESLSGWTPYGQYAVHGMFFEFELAAIGNGPDEPTITYYDDFPDGYLPIIDTPGAITAVDISADRRPSPEPFVDATDGVDDASYQDAVNYQAFLFADDNSEGTDTVPKFCGWAIADTPVATAGLLTDGVDPWAYETWGDGGYNWVAVPSEALEPDKWLYVTIAPTPGAVSDSGKYEAGFQRLASRYTYHGHRVALGIRSTWTPPAYRIMPFSYVALGPLGVVRQYPRDDARGLSSAPRIFPPTKARRIVGGYQ